MTDLWLAGWDRIPGESSGTWAPDDEIAAKLVLHATEGFAIGNAVHAYRANRSWPHVTVDPVRKRMVQHLPLNVPARALKNTTVPGQTNREANVLQVEIVGTSHLPATAKGKVSLAALTDEQNEWLGRVVVGPMCRLGGVAIKTDVTFYGEDCGWTLASSSARQRLTAAQFDKATGILGHQHVPENDHWDPGPIDIDAIITAARGAQPPTPEPSEDDMTPDQERWLKELHGELAAPIAPGGKDEHGVAYPHGNKAWQIGKIAKGEKLT